MKNISRILTILAPLGIYVALELIIHIFSLSYKFYTYNYTNSNHHSKKKHRCVLFNSIDLVMYLVFSWILKCFATFYEPANYYETFKYAWGIMTHSPISVGLIHIAKRICQRMLRADTSVRQYFLIDWTHLISRLNMPSRNIPLRAKFEWCLFLPQNNTMYSREPF